MDREKVIKGLECCTKWDSCSDCPYQTPNEYDISECTESLHKDALELLKKQMPIKPSSEHHLFLCPMCKNTLFREQKFCHECGKRIEWEGR